jgi:hypothetical protein
VAEQRTEQVRRNVSRWVAEETVQTVPRRILLRVPVDEGTATMTEIVPESGASATVRKPAVKSARPEIDADADLQEPEPPKRP